MTARRSLLLALTLLCSFAFSTEAKAGWSIGVSFGPRPVRGHFHYRRPYCRAPYLYRYRPVYVRPAPIIIERPVQVVRPVYEYQPAPAPVTPPPPRTSNISTVATGNSDTTFYLQKLRHYEENERREAAIQLGRLRAAQAVPALRATLTNDRGPRAREAAARALGLIGAVDALGDLDRAAQRDENRDVRNSASFAAEIIRSRSARTSQETAEPPR